MTRLTASYTAAFALALLSACSPSDPSAPVATTPPPVQTPDPRDEGRLM